MNHSSHTEVDGIPADGAFHALLDHLLEGCQVISYDWKYLYLNSTAVAHSHKTRGELLGKTMMQAYPGIENTPMFPILRRCMEERLPCQFENDFVYPDGSAGCFELRFEPVPAGVFILSIDISARKKAEADLKHIEEQLRQTQKIEAIGRLAAGVAHEFNNLLTIIHATNNALLEETPPADPRNEPMTEIKQATLRAISLTRQLLSFSRQQVLQPTVLDLNTIVTDTEKMLGRLIGTDVALTLKLADNLAHVKADPGQIGQVIINLVINARDAMSGGGTVTIETRNAEPDEPGTQASLDVTGPHVMLAVSDTGCGMDHATQARIFDPFFTTKEQGRGTGLGLSTVHGIVKQSGGSIRVSSEPGQGSSFRIYLPAVGNESAPAQSPVIYAHSSPRR